MSPNRGRVETRIAILNHPSAPHAHRWDEDVVRRLVELGFTAAQLNIAWGGRPGDEPLNLEDVVALGDADAAALPQPLALASDPARFEERRRQVQQRAALCRGAGLRTIFHFGAPYNHHTGRRDGAPVSCILDPAVLRRYQLLLDALDRDFDVDDLWLYTYDQAAWLCSEFGACPRCHGIPLQDRLVPFLDALAARWRSLNPKGRVWWEPWELSAGQVLRVVERVETAGFGLALHNNMAECMVAFAGDRHVRNFASLAAIRGIPVTIEGYFGAASEEVEPYLALQSPLATYSQVRTMMAIDGVTAVKEYYGLDLSKEDPNLEASRICFAEPDLTDEELLGRLSEGYGDRATRETVERVWRLASEAMWLYPWDVSWRIRKVGRRDPCHSLGPAFIHGEVADTPSWRSTRGATFIKIDDSAQHPWLLEDAQVRWELCAEKQGEALELAETVVALIPGSKGDAFRAFIAELGEFRRRVLAFAYHCRETNLVTVLNQALAAGEPAPFETVSELRQVMLRDRANMGTDDLTPALGELDRDPVAFAATYFSTQAEGA